MTDFMRSPPKRAIVFPQLKPLRSGPPRDNIARLEKLRDKLQVGLASSDDDLYKGLAGACRLARKVSAKESEWRAFCDHTDWIDFRQRPKAEDCADPLRHVIRFAVGIGKPGYARRRNTKLSSKYYAALKRPFAEEVPSKNIAELIVKNGGVEAMASASSTKPKSARTSASHVGLSVDAARELAFELKGFPVGTAVKLTAIVVKAGRSRKLRVMTGTKKPKA